LNTAIRITQPPFSNDTGRDALDLAMILATYEQSVALYFEQDGIYQLLKNINSQHILRKNYTSTFKALELYDIEKIYVNSNDLAQLGLKQNDLNIDVTMLSESDFFSLLNQTNTVLTF
jgi:tRNA 2-thiouridine synthesizing protein C